MVHGDFLCRIHREFDERIFFTMRTCRSIIKLTRDLLVFLSSIQTDYPIHENLINEEVIRFITSQTLLLMIAGVSVVMDLCWMRVRNSWILCSLLIGLLYSFCQKGWYGIVFFFAGAGLPILLLGGLFYFRMIGAGDIKVFSAIGGIMGPVRVLWCMWYAFFAGAFIAAGILLLCGGFKQRFLYLAEYVRAYILTGRRKPYYREGTAIENFHFTIPIFMSVMLYAGGMY